MTSPLVPVATAAALLLGCARPIVYLCGPRPLDRDQATLVDTSAVVDGHVLAIRTVAPGSHVRVPPHVHFEFPAVPAHIELVPGPYVFGAELFEGKIPPSWVTGSATVESGRCYAPAVKCESEVSDTLFCRLKEAQNLPFPDPCGDKPLDALVCRLVLAPTSCHANRFARHVAPKVVADR